MSKLHRFLSVAGFLGMAAILSSSLQGQPGKKANTTPQIAPAQQVSRLAEPADSRFAAPGVLTYQPLQGAAYFAVALQPKLDPAPRRPRDILIMLSSAATQAGPSWIAAHQIAEAILETASDNDRISLWTVNTPENTQGLTRGFLLAKDIGEARRLRDALTVYRNKQYPAGDTDLKHALTQAVKSFDANMDRQRILLFLGDGLSTHNPMDGADRLKIARQMVERRIAFFPVPLGVHLDPQTLHGLANSTGGVVLRTRVEEEKLVDALKRYEDAFAGPILYAATLTLPAEASGVCPTILPPLRSDTPTLVVGRMSKGLKQLDHTLAGIQPGRPGEVKVQARHEVLAPDLDNFFLVSMIDQWARAKEHPALLRADRALANAYENTRLEHLNKLESAQMALEENQLEAAGRLFRQARLLAPHDGQADAGIKIVDRLKDGTLTRDALKKQLGQRNTKVDQLKLVNGKQQWVKVDLVPIAQNDDSGVKNPKPGLGGEDLIKEQRDRQAVHEQKVANAVDDTIRQARRNLPADPDGMLDLLRGLLNRVKDHPDLGGRIRDALTARLQAALHNTAKDVLQIKLRKQDESAAVAQVRANLTAEQARRTFVERTEAQFRAYKGLMNIGRLEERTKTAILEAMVQIQQDARANGMPTPLATRAAYDIAVAGHTVQQHQSLVRRREEGWLAVLMNVEKAHMPYPDEPGIYFPPLPTWKALLKARKDKYAVSMLPNDEHGIAEATEISRLLQQVIDTKGLQEKVKLKTALEFFSDKFGDKLPILVDREAFADGQAEAADPYEEEVSLPPVPARMAMSTALRLILAQVGKGKATYLIRRSFVEITTNERYLADKVLRVYPVGDLVMPIGQAPAMGGVGLQFGGGLGGGFGGQFAGGGFGAGLPPFGGGGFAGGGFAGMPGPMGGGFGAPFGGGFGGFPGQPGAGFGGFPGQPGGGFGAPFGGGFGAPFGGGFPGQFGGGLRGGAPGGQFVGGTFQGAFNGSLGFQGATQAAGLIDVITRVVDPGNWNRPPVLQPFAMGGGFPGGVGMFGMVGLVGMAGNAGMIGFGPPPDPTLVPPDPQTSNSIDFFPPALALIVRAHSRTHTSIEGGFVNGKARRVDAALRIELERKLLANNAKDPKVRVAGVADDKTLDPLKVWNDAFAKSGITTGHVIATADFLFEAGEFQHAAEFLKANLRHGVAVRPWVFEALAIALEASGGDADEIRRVRLSGIALDPADAQSFLSAARAMAERGQHDRALAFCKQAALLEPSDYHPYELALAFAAGAKDAKGMEWAAGNLVSQDWPVDSLAIHENAKKRLRSLAATLKTDRRVAEADRLEAKLAQLNRRDLVIQLTWENANGPAELELKVKEPSGSFCTLEQKQSPGGGVLIGCNLTDKEPISQYIAAQAFDGEYEITIARVFGQTLGNRARLSIIENAGTPQQTRRLETIRLVKNATIKVHLKEGRRTELATVSPAAQQRREPRKPESASSVFNELRAVANPNFYGASVVGVPSVAALAAKDRPNQTATTIAQGSLQSGGVPMTTQVRLGADQRSLDLVIRPFFQAVNAASNRPAVNLSVIPGGAVEP